MTLGQPAASSGAVATGLEGRVVIVTGGGQGIGEGVSHALAARGAAVVVVDRNPETGQAVAHACGGTFFEADVSSSRDADRVVETVVSQRGRLDGLVNNAGITRPVKLWDIDDEHWNEIQSVNASGTFFFLRAAVRAMIAAKSGGSIVNMSSIAGKGYRNTSSAAYAASKGAIIGLTRAAAMQVAEFDIRVNAICPGVTLTPLVAPRLQSNPDKLADIPLRRANTPGDVGVLAAFLISDLARTVTGQSWNVDGGIILD